MSVKRYSIAGTNATPAGWHDYVLAADYDKIVAQSLKLRDKLLEYAKNCECGNTGIVKVRRPDPWPDISAAAAWIEEDCPMCADIREVLEQ